MANAGPSGYARRGRRGCPTSPARATVNSAIDLSLALLIASVTAVSIWYFVDHGDGLKGELAVRLGGESLGLHTLGDREDLWDYGGWCKFVAAENPPTDDRLVEWLAAQPEVSNIRATREPDRSEFARSRCDTKLTVRYDRPGHLELVPIDWAAFGYRVPQDVPPTRVAGLLGKPKVKPGHSRGIMWLIAVGSAHAALLVVVVARGIIWLFRRRSPVPPPPWVFETDSDEEDVGHPPSVPPAESSSAARVIALVVGAAMILLGLVALHERLVGDVVPHATARGWVWFSSMGWPEKDKARERVYLAFLLAPLGAQLFFRYLLVGRWRAAGRPTTGVLLTAGVFAFLWLDLSLVPLGLVVGGSVGWLALRGVPVVGLFALHALVNSVLFGFLQSGSAPPDGHDSRLEGSWVKVDGSPKTLKGRIAFTANGRAVIPLFHNDGIPSDESINYYYLALDRDRVLYGVGGGTGKFRIAFKGNELVFTPAHRSPTEPTDRYRRVAHLMR